MSKLRIRRGDKVLGSTDEDGLNEWLESGLISEFDLVAVGEGEDWQLIRDFVANKPAAPPPPVADAPSAPDPTPPNEDELPPVAVDDAPADSDSDYRPLWEDDEDDGGSVDEDSQEFEIPNVVEEPPTPPPNAPRAAPAESAEAPRKRSSRSSAEHPVVAGDVPDEAAISEIFRQLVKWEAEAPTVADPREKSDPRLAGKRKSAGRSDSGTTRAKAKKKRRAAPPSDSEQRRRTRRRRPS